MSDIELAGRVAVITGGTRGAGKALAEFFWTHRFGDPLLSAETFRLAPLGTLAQIDSKTKSVDEVQGQYIGLLRFTPEGWTEVVRIHSTLSAGERDRMYMTGTLQGVVDAGQLAITVISYAVDWDEFASVGDLHTSKRLAWPE